MSTRPEGLIITDIAISSLKAALESFNVPDHGIRITAINQGCAGVNYSLEPQPSPVEHDTVLDLADNTLKVFIDPTSYLYLKDVTLDYKQIEGHSGFVFFHRKVGSPSCQGCSKKCH